MENHIDLVVPAVRFAEELGCFNEVTDCSSLDDYIIVSLMDTESDLKVEPEDLLFQVDLGLNHIPTEDWLIEEFNHQWMIGREFTLSVLLDRESDKLIFMISPFIEDAIITRFSENLTKVNLEYLREDYWGFLNEKGALIIERYFSNGEVRPEKFEFIHPNGEKVYKRKVERYED